MRDGVNGLTFRLGDGADLAARLRTLAHDRQTLLALQRGIAPPQGMDEVAARVEQLYSDLLARAEG